MKYIAIFVIFCHFMTHNLFANDLDPKNYKEQAKIILIDRLEENAQEFTIKKNTILPYKNIEITLETCWTSKEKKNEDMAKISVVEFKKNTKDEDGKKIFNGWIARNNKKISNLEHKIYQIHLDSCV